MKKLSVFLASLVGIASSVAATAAPVAVTVDIDRANLLKSYQCDLNGYGASGTSSTGSFTNCTLVNTFTSTTPADYGPFSINLTGVSLSLLVTGCKQDSFTILGTNAHIEFICPKTP
jgi:hypothetical protein